MLRSRSASGLTLLLVWATTACGAGGGAARDEGSPELTVLAAASLTDVFEDLAVQFEADHDATVRFSFASSTDLAQQAADGAPGDVLATADTASMAVAQDAGVTGDVAEIASNVLVVVTRPGNPDGIGSLADLEATSWVRCADEAPCGRVAVEVLDAAGVTAEPVSLEDDARATLDKVTSGEVDAGLVYATDAVAAGDEVSTVEIPEAAADPTTYAVTTLEQATEPALAREWVDLLLSDEGRQALRRAGFAPAGPGR